MTDERKREAAQEWRTWREAHDMSQAMLAAALSIGLRTVQGIELAEHYPSFTSRLRFKALKKKHEQEDAK